MEELSTLLSQIFTFINNIFIIKNIQMLRYSYFFWYICVMIILSILSIWNPSGIMTSDVNTYVYSSVTVILILSLLSSYYKTSKISNEQTFETLLFRQNIFVFSIIFLTIMINVFLYNPYGITHSYSFPLYFLLLLSIFVVISTFLSFSNYTETKKYDNMKNLSFLYNSLKFFGFSILSVIVMTIVVTMIVRFFHISTVALPIFFNKILSVFIILSIVTLIYRVYEMYSLANPSGIANIKSNPYIKILLDVLFFIPLFFLDCIDFFFKEYKNTPTGVVVVFLIEVFIFLLLLACCYLYTYISKKYYYEGGLQILNEPIGLNTETTVTDNYGLYSSFPQTVKYNFSISSWFYIDTNNNNINKDFIVLNYSYNPFVVYNPSSNMFSVYLLNNEKYQKCVNEITGPKTDSELNTCRISSSDMVYSTYDLPLQKWNHIVLVYANGFLDVFLNNELVKSINIVIPILEQSTITVGMANGIHGGICNMLFFKESLSVEKIHILYKSVEKENPPIPTVKMKLF